MVSPQDRLGGEVGVRERGTEKCSSARETKKVVENIFERVFRIGGGGRVKVQVVRHCNP